MISTVFTLVHSPAFDSIKLVWVAGVGRARGLVALRAVPRRLALRAAAPVVRRDREAGGAVRTHVRSSAPCPEGTYFTEGVANHCL